MGYFRAIVESGEISERVLELTEIVLGMSAGNYTAWDIRKKCILDLKKDLEEELIFVENMIEG